MALQVFIIFIGKSPMHIVNDGLTGVQWGICIGFSAITFVVSFIVKLIPIQNLIEKCVNSKNDNKEEEVKEVKEVSESNEYNVEKIKVKEYQKKNITIDEYVPKEDKNIIELNAINENDLNSIIQINKKSERNNLKS